MEALILTIALSAPPVAKAPCPDCDKAKAALAAKKSPAPAGPAVSAAPPAPSGAVVGTHSVRVRVFERFRTGDGPVRRLARALRAGCL